MGGMITPLLTSTGRDLALVLTALALPLGFQFLCFLQRTLQEDTEDKERHAELSTQVFWNNHPQVGSVITGM